MTETIATYSPPTLIGADTVVTSARLCWAFGHLLHHAWANEHYWPGGYDDILVEWTPQDLAIEAMRRYQADPPPMGGIQSFVIGGRYDTARWTTQSGRLQLEAWPAHFEATVHTPPENTPTIYGMAGYLWGISIKPSYGDGTILDLRELRINTWADELITANRSGLLYMADERIFGGLIRQRVRGAIRAGDDRAAAILAAFEEIDREVAEEMAQPTTEREAA